MNLYMFVCVQVCMCVRARGQPESRLGITVDFYSVTEFLIAWAQKHTVGTCGKESGQRAETWGIMKDYDEGTKME